jgi:site-specific DNA-methyltransferase (adenine-specific)
MDKITNTTEPQIAYSECYAQVFSHLFLGDCLIESEKIETGSVDLILTDLPYGTMKGINEEFAGYGRKNHDGHLWDNVIDIKKIMQIANRILRKNGKMVLTAQDPFSTELKINAIANLPFNYSMIWKKNDFANALISKKAPVNYYEDILVFSKTHNTYEEHNLLDYSLKLRNYTNYSRSKFKSKLGHIRYIHLMEISKKRNQGNLCTEEVYMELINVFNIDKMEGFKDYNELEKLNKDFKNKYPSTFNLWEGKKYKSNILKYKKDYTGDHPTQKPVLLLEDLIKTFSNESNLVCDLTMGSGSTGVACKNTNRSFIGIEKDEAYFKIAEQRINARTLFS